MQYDACTDLHIFNLYMYVNAYIHGCIWPYIHIYAEFWCPRGVQDFFAVHSHPGIWCMLHQADTAMVQHHPTSMQKAIVPA